MKKKNKPVINQQQPITKATENSPKHVVQDTVSTKKDTAVGQPIDMFSNSKIALGILSALLFAAGFWILKDFLLGKKTNLFLDIGSDMANAFYPFNKIAIDYFKQYGSGGWSFKQGMGQDITPLYNSPIYYLLALGESVNIPINAIKIEFLRLIINGLVFFWYARTIKMNTYTSIIGSLCFALMGFFSLTFGWTPLLADWQLFVILMLIALEYLIQYNNWYLLPIFVMFMAINQPFNLVVIAEFTIIYLLVKLYIEDKLTDWVGNAKLVGKIVFFGGLGIGMGFLMAYAHILTMLNSPRGSGDVALTNTLSSIPILQMADGQEFFTSLLRWFSNDILGTTATYRSWQNYMEAPAFYIGVGMLILLPQLFVVSNRRQRIAYGAVTGFVLFIITFPYFRYALWLFTGNYYRVLAAFIAIGLLMGSLKVIDALLKGAKVNIIVLIATFLALSTILFYLVPKEMSELINKTVRTSAFIFMFFYTLLLAGTRVENIKKALLWAFLGLTFIELIYFNNITTNKRDVLSVNDYQTRTGFNDYTKEALDFIDKQDKSFYRVEKSYSSGNAIHQSFNDAMVQGYNSTSNYYSFNHRNHVAFLKGFGTLQGDDETSTRWLIGVRARPLLMPVASVKYYLVKGQLPFQKETFDSLATFQDVKVFKVKYALPMGFTYSKYISEDFFKKLSMLQKDVSTYRAFVVKESEKANFKGLEEVKDSVTNLSFDNIKLMTDELKQDTLAISKFDDRNFEGSIDLDRPKLLFLSIPHDKGWKVEIDGKPAETQKVTFGMTGVMLEKGKHQVKMYYEAPYLKLGSMISGISIALYALLVGFTFWRKKKIPLTPEGELYQG